MGHCRQPLPPHGFLHMRVSYWSGSGRAVGCASTALAHGVPAPEISRSTPAQERSGWFCDYISTLFLYIKICFVASRTLCLPSYTNVAQRSKSISELVAELELQVKMSPAASFFDLVYKWSLDALHFFSIEMFTTVLVRAFNGNGTLLILWAYR